MDPTNALLALEVQSNLLRLLRFRLVSHSGPTTVAPDILGITLMTSIDLMTMSLAELTSLQKDVQKAIKEFSERRKQEAMMALETKAQELGFSLSDLISVKKKRKSSSAVGPKYRQPENPDVTWSGHGRRPTWFVEAVEAGKTPGSMAV